ncbi:MAG: lysophospholipid acyltransferase family protein [Candidatus Binatia bacterium]
MKKVRLWLLCRLSEGALVSFRGIFRALPADFSRLISAFFIKILISLLLPRKRIVKNLDWVFGETYASATKEGLAKGIQFHFARNVQDCLFQWFYPDHARPPVRVRGIENLDAALAKGKGVIALGAHIGNFILVGTTLGINGYPVHTLFRIPSDKRIQALIGRHIKSFHQTIIPSLPRKEAVKRVLETLRRGEIVFILADNLKKGRVRTHFFGQPVRSPRGPVSLALRSRASVLPIYLIRNYQGELDLVIEPEIAMTRDGNLSADIASNTRRITVCLEDLVRRYPDQWNWLTVSMGGEEAPRSTEEQPDQLVG